MNRTMSKEMQKGLAMRILTKEGSVEGRDTVATSAQYWSERGAAVGGPMPPGFLTRGRQFVRWALIVLALMAFVKVQYDLHGLLKSEDPQVLAVPIGLRGGTAFHVSLVFLAAFLAASHWTRARLSNALFASFYLLSLLLICFLPYDLHGAVAYISSTVIACSLTLTLVATRDLWRGGKPGE
jgi:hypothetical protein